MRNQYDNPYLITCVRQEVTGKNQLIFSCIELKGSCASVTIHFSQISKKQEKKVMI